MLARHEPRIRALVDPGQRILEVGGTAAPWELATHRIGGIAPRADMAWIDHDLGRDTPWPFDDQAFDFCVCPAGTLEVLPDPILVCREMVRVARRGYLEATSRAVATARGQAPGVAVGLPGHRHLVEIRVPAVVFLPNGRLLREPGRLGLPAWFANELPEEARASALFWEDGFEVVMATEPSRAELLAYSRSVLPDPTGAGLRHALRQLSRRYPRLARPVRRMLRAMA